MEALRVLKDEKMVENADAMGEVFRTELNKIENPLLELVRGRGLLNAIVVKEELSTKGDAMAMCMRLRDLGLLAKPTHGNIIRLAPPLCITEDQIKEGVGIIKTVLD